MKGFTNFGARPLIIRNWGEVILLQTSRMPGERENISALKFSTAAEVKSGNGSVTAICEIPPSGFKPSSEKL